MKAVLISIQPKWCELIASGKKTVEVRKTRPKRETPFKCYIYCTKPKKMFRMSSLLYSYSDNLIRNEVDGSFTVGDGLDFWGNETPHTYLNGYVIGEFVCDEIVHIESRGTRYITAFGEAETNRIARESRLNFGDMQKYLGSEDGFAWHISDLKIYDKPRELSEFTYWLGFISDYTTDSHGHLKRPPQSWCYVEENDQSRCGDSLKIMKEWENEK